MKVKVILGIDARRWRYSEDSSLESLNEFAASSFNLSNFWLQYEDDEGDRLTINSKNDFEDAFACAVEEERKSLKIYVIEGSLPSAQRPKNDSIPSPSKCEQKSNENEQQQQPQQQNDASNNCQQLFSSHLFFTHFRAFLTETPNYRKAAAIDFLKNEQIILLLPALHRRIFEAIRAAKDKNCEKWDSPQSIEKIMRNILETDAKFQPIISHKLYIHKLQAMIPMFAKKISFHLPILMNFSTEAIAAWIPHLTSVLGHGLNEYGNAFAANTNTMSSFFPLMCSFMKQHGDYSGLPSFCSRAADRDSNGDIIHHGVQCDACGISPIKGVRFKCVICSNFDLCAQCESFHKHDANHPLIKFHHSANKAVPPFHGLHEILHSFGARHHWRGGRHHGHGPHGHGGRRGRGMHPPHPPHHHQWWQHQQQQHAQAHGQNNNQWNGQQQQQQQQRNGNRGWNGWGKKWRWNQCGQQQQNGNNQWGQSQSQWWNNDRNCDNVSVISSNLSKDESVVENKKKVKVMAEFVTDVTLPDRSYYPTDTVLTKTWKMRNNGDNEWGNNVELVFFKGNESLTLEKRYPVNNALSGQEVEVSAVIKTPKKPGRYCSYYRLQRNSEYFGPRVWVDIFAVDENENDVEMNKKWKKHLKKEQKVQRLEKRAAKIEAKVDRVCNKLNNQKDGMKSDKLVKKREKLLAKQEKLKQKVEKVVAKHQKNDNEVVIDEQQLLDDIANAAVQDLGLNDAQSGNKNKKKEAVQSSLSCVCGSLLHKTSPIAAYNASSQVNCDICGCFIPSSGVIYHCPNVQSVHHPEGYDLCPNCVEYQMQFGKDEPLKNDKVEVAPVKEKVEIEVVGPPPAAVDVFEYAEQLEQLKAMGFSDEEKIKQELIKQKGNVQRVANALLHM